MEIYVLKDGARRGPFLPFKLRELLEDKEFLPSDPGWVEGMENWAPLSSIEAISNWMPRDPSMPPPLPDFSELQETTATTTGGGSVPSSPEAATHEEIAARRVRAWLRWFARLVDEMLWFGLIWTAGVSAGWLGLWDFLVRHPALLLGPAFLWIPVEAFLISRFTTTPGKYLLGMQVTDDLGQPLSYVAALKRSGLVLVLGNGLGLPFMMLLPMLQGAMAWVLYRRTGTTLWDRAANSQLRHITPSPVGMLISGLIIASWMAVGSWISFTAPMPVDFPADQRGRIEEMRQQFDQNWKKLQSAPSASAGPRGIQQDA